MDMTFLRQVRFLQKKESHFPMVVFCITAFKFLSFCIYVASKTLHRKSGDDQLQLFDLSEIEDDTTTSMKETLTLRKGRFFLGSGDKHLEKEDGDKAEAAYHNALAAFKQVADSNVKCNFVGGVNYGLGEVESLRAEKLFEDNKMERNSQPSFIQALLKSISYYEEAKKCSQDDELKFKVYKELAAKCVFYARYSQVETAGNSGLTVENAFRKAIDAYQSLVLKEKCGCEDAHTRLYYSKYQSGICMRLFKTGKVREARLKSTLVIRLCRESIKYFGPESNSPIFTSILTDMANHYLDMNVQHNEKTLELAISALLEAVQIPEKHADEWCKYVSTEFWDVLNKVLMRLLRKANKNKSRIKEVVEKSLRLKGSLSDLKEIHDMWKSCNSQ
ncbi:hypothetical protein DY000_02061198 [Brassica cretica]|uniref:Uncharacterized protein n=1 Tax=Brassica cretica TaxID=69181 RepID=A0ABQ7B087_BRACR|nr:hypothetical protein DY000_02061198 [Brassica cretica]